MDVTVTCPTCGIGRTETHCDHCGNYIPPDQLYSTATMLTLPNVSVPRWLCSTCSGVALVPGSVGTPEPTPIGG